MASREAGSHLQDDVLRHSLDKPEEFWARQAEHLHWHKKPTETLRHTRRALKDGSVTHDSWEWFPGGEISTCYNCIDRHVEAGRGDNVAIYYDSPVTKTKETYSYRRLLDEVGVLAGVLRSEGVKRGDVVMLYMPMIPSALIGMYAVNRLGAVHAVVFGGFAPNALAQRIEACKPVAILTASCGIDGNKPPIAYQPLVEEAIRISSHKPPKTFIWQRPQVRWNPDRNSGQATWQKVVRSARARQIKADCVPVASTDPVYIIHTSGTTGAPKGVMRDAAGHAVGLNLSISYLFNIHGPGDVAFTASDIGWVVGHSYIVYAPLLAGASTVLYEGKPVGTPDASAFWRVVEEYGVNMMFTAPTALRAIRRDDPENKFLSTIGGRGGLRSLKSLFLAGERSEPSLISMYQELLKKYGAPDAHVIDNWWSSESGSPITGRALVPHTGADRASSIRNHPPATIKPGSAGKAMPGFDVRVVDDEGRQVTKGSMGNIVLGMPLAPTAFRTLWEDEERFYKSYLKRFNGKWLDTGDAGMIDEDGYVHVMSRNDDVLNVSAHRLSSGGIEQAITSHPLVAEASVVGIPDAIKGQLPFAFITLSTADHPASAVPDEKVASEIQALIRKQVGAIASLGGIIQGKGMIPKTRSGKTLRRVLRELVENGVHGEFDKKVTIPSTVEDSSVVEVARTKVREYFERSDGKHAAVEGLKSKL
ncbi:AMP-dependent synthetase/ligase [Metarhizium guizhouense ARSEF 977]|uniref:AMP-dependent synthetase/ligase n=1 Tax=Metarhizium guizhouense (strain ARSEF 977) TaxID=1276136 RepID=A0A0B4H6W8_METGA|nr:AMP-dependent synthetase/ligase [Metarhizium guizhouense ARSEF 977]